jgi:hypothetical protein
VEQLVFLLLIGAISLIQWLAKKSQEAREAREQEAEWQEREARVKRQPAAPPARLPRQASHRPVETEEERVRRFLEALGIPEAPVAPPPVPPVVRRELPTEGPASPAPAPEPPPVPPRRPPKKKERVVLPTAPEPAPALSADLASPLISSSDAPAYATERMATMHPPKTMEPASNQLGKIAVAEILASPESVRTALLLREILGPPRGLVPFDLARIP